MQSSLKAAAIRSIVKRYNPQKLPKPFIIQIDNIAGFLKLPVKAAL